MAKSDAVKLDPVTPIKDTLKLLDTAAAILIKNLCHDTNATKATYTLEGLTFEGERLGNYTVIVERNQTEGGSK